jgi:hypothetical protein
MVFMIEVRTVRMSRRELKDKFNTNEGGYPNRFVKPDGTLAGSGKYDPKKLSTEFCTPARLPITAPPASPPPDNP